MKGWFDPVKVKTHRLRTLVPCELPRYLVVAYLLSLEKLQTHENA